LAVATSSLFAASIILVLLGIPAYLSRTSGWIAVYAAIFEHVDGASLYTIVLSTFGNNHQVILTAGPV